MYIRPRQMWWFPLLFAGLFALGMSIGFLTDKPETSVSADQQAASEEAKQKLVEDRNTIKGLLSQLDTTREVPFQISVKDETYEGTFHGELFELKGKVSGHDIHMKRTGERIAVLIDGEAQNPDLLPYALYTPYEHANLIKGQLTSIEPQVIPSANQQGLLGYQVSLPPSEVRALLTLWMGPHFKADTQMEQVLHQFKIIYQLWYEPQTAKLKQMVVNLKLDTPIGKRQDQLVFTF
ncbi:hypothetical protein [Brevibacillus dissolubilis]|uniref:hypothetical protein n=1 Tax=Brevibacillus dissolubilis TaxID=1844116 RepID=UPI00111660BF|nr:hypothetical protein [Brevibacillus dissolubilis]